MLLIETCYYWKNQVFGCATNRDMSLIETCFYSRLYGIQNNGHRKVESTSKSCLEAHAGFFRLSIFDINRSSIKHLLFCIDFRCQYENMMHEKKRILLKKIFYHIVQCSKRISLKATQFKFSVKWMLWQFKSHFITGEILGLNRQWNMPDSSVIRWAICV